MANRSSELRSAWSERVRSVTSSMKPTIRRRALAVTEEVPPVLHPDHPAVLAGKR